MAESKRYRLASTGGLTEVSYTLVVKEDASAFVERRYDYEQPYKKDRVEKIELEALGNNLVVDGINIAEAAQRKLSEIRSKSN